MTRPMTEHDRDEMRRSDHDKLIRMDEKQSSLTRTVEDMKKQMKDDHETLRKELMELKTAVEPIFRTMAGMNSLTGFIKHFGGAALIIAVVWNLVRTIIDFATSTLPQ